MPKSRTADIAPRCRVRPGGKFRLADIDPSATPGFAGGKGDAAGVLDELAGQLSELQELLYAEHRRRVLIVLQGMDTAGKDGTIRHVFRGVNPQGVNVVAFKVPTPAELAHDFLWRVHRHVPGDGQITIFNRSHYEDVLVVRVHKLAPAGVWKKRYAQINDFERMLAESGTTVLKFFLHIDPDEQKRRLQARLDDRTKRWKFNIDDLGERKRWPDYLEAYEDAIRETSTPWAPWHVVPSNRKWFRNLAVGSTIVSTLEGLKMKYPSEPPGLDDVVIA